MAFAKDTDDDAHNKNISNSEIVDCLSSSESNSRQTDKSEIISAFSQNHSFLQ